MTGRATARWVLGLVVAAGAAVDAAGPASAAPATCSGTVTASQGGTQTTRIGTAFPQPLQVLVCSGGNPVPGATVTFTAPTSGASGTFQLSGTTTYTTTTDSTGTASSGTFTANSTAGSYTVTAATTQFGGADFSLTNTAAGVAAGITSASGGNQSATVGTQYASPLQAQVVDANGNPVQNVNVTFTVQPGSGGAGATFAAGGSTATAATSSSGVATSPLLNANQVAGPFNVSASTPGLAGTAVYALTNAASAPSAVSAGSGSSQQTPVGTAFTVPLGVMVTDASKNPVPGVTVTFTAPAHGASGSFPGGSAASTAVTDSSGVAVAPTFTANETPGGYIVTASVPGVGASAAFSLVNQAPGAGSTGYWLVAADGGVFSYGSAGYFGSAGGLHLRSPVVGMAATPDGAGYWLVAADGGVFSYGDARFFGSAGALHLKAPVVGMAATPDGAGYWLVGSDGGVFTYGTAGYHGSAAALPLSAPVVGLAATPDGAGYWLAASDGGVFRYGSAGYHGSAASSGDRAVRGLAVAPGGAGYWLADAAGIVYGYGSAPISGSPAASGTALASPVVGVAVP